ncbi:MAG: isoleucine--tRNA ligase [Chloroflexota bacterium]|nr:isoleucine--tRNA ligase [Chloroflexota bacterium]
MFKPVPSKVDFVQMEKDLLAWWDECGIVAKYLIRNDDSGKRFSFVDGPITANNPMGVHHAWGRTYKDLFQRYKTMQGFEQRYQNGFDGQGLWIEVNVEKDLGMTSKTDIEEYGVGKFVDLCKERVRRFADVQTQQSIRLGYWMDWDNSYHTMSDENNYTIWHFLKVCHQKGYIYEGRDVMPWCPRCGTGISHHEIVTEGYKDITHPSLYVRFPLIDRPGEALLIWTTTPWTLTSNVAVAAHPDLTYVKVKVKGTAPDGGDETLYLIKSRLEALKAEYEVIGELKGRELEGLRYHGPFDELPAQEGVEHRVILWDEVSESDGTGLVHNAPGAGEEDYALSKEYDLPAIAPLDEFGQFLDGFGELTGLSVFEVPKPIFRSLREKGTLYRLDQITHRYPVCWRCDTELVFRLVDEWFISMEELRHDIAEVTKKITWIPEFGMGRELDWLRNMDDWMISKKRYYGLALPIYKCDDCGDFEVIGSEVELKERAVEGWERFEGHSPHRPWIDEVKIACEECGVTASRIKDVGNPWLDAGIVTFSTLGYRHDKDYWKKWFPADLISESFPGQFRNWFYSLLTMSTALENTEPFRANFTYATLMDEKGDEMHKSKGNAIEFEEGADQMGVDAMRWMYSGTNPASNLLFGFGRADETRRRMLIPLWNVYSFFTTYANIDGYTPETPAPPVGERAELDRWIISELNELIRTTTASLDRYDPQTTVREIDEFVERLSNWYVRRSRRRFWKSEVDTDKVAAFATLHECLTTLVKLMAPFVPFVTEEIYQNIGRNGERESVHLEDWPVADESLIDTRLDDATRLAMRLSSLGRAARSKAGIKVRQPVASVAFKLRTDAERELLEQVSPQVRDELNTKEISVLDDVSTVANLEIKPNFQLLGPKYERDVGRVAGAISKAEPSEVFRKVSANRQVTLGDYTLEPDEIVVSATDKQGYSVIAEQGYSAAVTTELTADLELEGRARELVHQVQNMRRDAGFDIADRITTYYTGDTGIDEVIAAHGGYIRQETLSDDLVRSAPPEEAHAESHRINGMEADLGVVAVK